MACFTRNRRHKALAYEIAETLLRTLVDEEADFHHPQRFDVMGDVMGDVGAETTFRQCHSRGAT